MPKVTVIPPSINRATRQDISAPTRRKVAAYARVSTDFEEQLTSYEAQISYYTNYIQRNPDWEFVKIYTDEGISATSTKHREGFNSMIADALDGKNRLDYHKKCFSVRSKYGRFPHYHPKIEGTSRGMFL